LHLLLGNVLQPPINPHGPANNVASAAQRVGSPVITAAVAPLLHWLVQCGVDINADIPADYAPGPFSDVHQIPDTESPGSRQCFECTPLTLAVQWDRDGALLEQLLALPALAVPQSPPAAAAAAAAAAAVADDTTASHTLLDVLAPNQSDGRDAGPSTTKDRLLMLLKAGWGCTVSQARTSLWLLCGAASSAILYTAAGYSPNKHAHTRGGAIDLMQLLLTPDCWGGGVAAEVPATTVATFRLAVQTAGQKRQSHDTGKQEPRLLSRVLEFHEFPLVRVLLRAGAAYLPGAHADGRYLLQMSKREDVGGKLQRYKIFWEEIVAHADAQDRLRVHQVT
jgi:hypothetical protein